MRESAADSLFRWGALLGEADDRLPRDAVEEAVRRRRVEFAIDQQEDVGPGRLGHLTAVVEHQCVLIPGRDRFIQIVSCNTHNITTLIKTLCDEGGGKYALERGTFVCMRRANDISQTKDFAPAPQVGKHDDAEFGTHHAHDAFHVFETLHQKFDLFSSAVKLNTQYMHSIWFNLAFNRDITKDEMVERLKGNLRVAVTDKRNCNEIFSFGRDHGYYGRILSQTVVVLPTLAVRRKRELYGFCFTPQDGNSLLSSVAAALWLIEPDQESLSKRLDPLRRFMYQEI